MRNLSAPIPIRPHLSGRLSPVETVPIDMPANEDVLCPLCEYNLRGLAEPRCPECGHRSTWEELRNRPPLHPYLFEHHPKRNVGSFVRTVFGSLRPIKFWRSVSPTMKLRPGRLALFALLVTLIAMLTVAAGMSGDITQLARNNAEMRKVMARMHQGMMTPGAPGYDPKTAAGIQSVIQQYGSLEEYEAQRYPRPGDWLFWQDLWRTMWSARYHQVLLHRPVMIVLLWAPLTFASLLIFRVSLRQAQINYLHVVRCVVYSAAILALVGPYLLIATLLLVRWIPWGGYTQFGYVDNVYIACAILLLILTYRLAMAYRLYLRFPHAIATVLSSQIIVALILLKLDMVMLGH